MTMILPKEETLSSLVFQKASKTVTRQRDSFMAMNSPWPLLHFMHIDMKNFTFFHVIVEKGHYDIIESAGSKAVIFCNVYAAKNLFTEAGNESTKDEWTVCQNSLFLYQ